MQGRGKRGGKWRSSKKAGNGVAGGRRGLAPWVSARAPAWAQAVPHQNKRASAFRLSPMAADLPCAIEWSYLNRGLGRVDHWFIGRRLKICYDTAARAVHSEALAFMQEVMPPRLSTVGSTVQHASSIFQKKSTGCDSIGMDGYGVGLDGGGGCWGGCGAPRFSKRADPLERRKRAKKSWVWGVASRGRGRGWMGESVGGWVVRRAVGGGNSWLSERVAFFTLNVAWWRISRGREFRRGGINDVQKGCYNRTAFLRLPLKLTQTD